MGVKTWVAFWGAVGVFGIWHVVCQDLVHSLDTSGWLVRAMRLVLLSGAFLLWLALPALAQEGKGDSEKEMEEAAEKFGKAERYYKIGKYEEALKFYEESYVISGQPDLLFNIAQCYRQLGNYEEAIKMYKRFIKDSKDKEKSKRAEEILADIEGLVIKKDELSKKEPVDPVKVPPASGTVEEPVEPAKVPPASLSVAGLEVKVQPGSSGPSSLVSEEQGPSTLGAFETSPPSPVSRSDRNVSRSLLVVTSASALLGFSLDGLALLESLQVDRLLAAQLGGITAFADVLILSPLIADLVIRGSSTSVPRTWDSKRRIHITTTSLAAVGIVSHAIMTGLVFFNKDDEGLELKLAFPLSVASSSLFAVSLASSVVSHRIEKAKLSAAPGGLALSVNF